MLKEPIIVDRKTNIILDGHHRYNCAKILGLKKIPAYLVNYLNKDIKVEKRREDIEINKEIVINKAMHNELFPPKTTKHILKKKPNPVNMMLSDLK